MASWLEKRYKRAKKSVKRALRKTKKVIDNPADALLPQHIRDSQWYQTGVRPVLNVATDAGIGFLTGGPAGAISAGAGSAIGEITNGPHGYGGVGQVIQSGLAGYGAGNSAGGGAFNDALSGGGSFTDAFNAGISTQFGTPVGDSLMGTIGNAFTGGDGLSGLASRAGSYAVNHLGEVGALLGGGGGQPQGGGGGQQYGRGGVPQYTSPSGAGATIGQRQAALINNNNARFTASIQARDLAQRNQIGATRQLQRNNLLAQAYSQQGSQRNGMLTGIGAALQGLAAVKAARAPTQQRPGIASVAQLNAGHAELANQVQGSVGQNLQSISGNPQVQQLIADKNKAIQDNVLGTLLPTMQRGLSQTGGFGGSVQKQQQAQIVNAIAQQQTVADNQLLQHFTDQQVAQRGNAARTMVTNNQQVTPPNKNVQDAALMAQIGGMLKSSTATDAVGGLAKLLGGGSGSGANGTTGTNPIDTITGGIGDVVGSVGGGIGDVIGGIGGGIGDVVTAAGGVGKDILAAIIKNGGKISDMVGKGAKGIGDWLGGLFHGNPNSGNFAYAPPPTPHLTMPNGGAFPVPKPTTPSQALGGAALSTGFVTRANPAVQPPMMGGISDYPTMHPAVEPYDWTNYVEPTPAESRALRKTVDDARARLLTRPNMQVNLPSVDPAQAWGSNAVVPTPQQNPTPAQQNPKLPVATTHIGSMLTGGLGALMPPPAQNPPPAAKHTPAIKPAPPVATTHIGNMLMGGIGALMPPHQNPTPAKQNPRASVLSKMGGARRVVGKKYAPMLDATGNTLRNSRGEKVYSPPKWLRKKGTSDAEWRKLALLGSNQLLHGT